MAVLQPVIERHFGASRLFEPRKPVSSQIQKTENPPVSCSGRLLLWCGRPPCGVFTDCLVLRVRGVAWVDVSSFNCYGPSGFAILQARREAWATGSVAWL